MKDIFLEKICIEFLILDMFMRIIVDVVYYRRIMKEIILYMIIYRYYMFYISMVIYYTLIFNLWICINI